MEGLKSKPCAFGATSARRVCFIVRKVPAVPSVRRVAWRGPEEGARGQAFGEGVYVPHGLCEGPEPGWGWAGKD